MSKEYSDMELKAIAIADDVCAPLLEAKNEAACWLTVAENRYDGAWNGAHEIALESLRKQ